MDFRDRLTSFQKKATGVVYGVKDKVRGKIGEYKEKRAQRKLEREQKDKERRDLLLKIQETLLALDLQQDKLKTLSANIKDIDGELNEFTETIPQPLPQTGGKRKTRRRRKTSRKTSRKTRRNTRRKTRRRRWA